MDTSKVTILQSIKLFVITAFITTMMLGCEGDQGAPGAPGTTDVVVTSNAPPTSLAITIDSVAINSAPVVELNAKDQDGLPFIGLSSGDLSFAIAKLVPGSLGNPSNWQSYLNTQETATVGPGTGNTTVHATRESNGKLVNHGDGSYTYTFATDITNVTAPLAVAYDPTLTHRIAIQVGNGFPVSNPIYTFRPSDGATSGIFSRDIVKIESCNECHNQLALHGGGRVDTQYCVICHNPGTTDANSGNTVDFKVMIHKIHRGANLKLVQGADKETFDDLSTAADETADNGEYAIWGYRDNKHDYSTVVYPAGSPIGSGIQTCDKCHDSSDPGTPQGDNWKTQLSMEACGSCHDNIKFDVAGPPIPGATDPDGHPGGVVSDNAVCITCHAAGGPARSVEQAHFLAEPLARRNYKLNILKICGTDVDTVPGPVCAPGVAPTVTFSVTDPLNGDAKYDIISEPEFGSGSSLSFLVAWDTRDYNNTDGTGTRPGRADSISISGAVAAADPLTFTVTAGFIIPDGTGATGYTASGTGAVGAQGRLAGDFDGDGIYNESAASNSLTTEQERIYVKSEVKFFSIDGNPIQERRQTVSNDKCNKCHEQVSFHGGSRSGEYGVCILCHNPNNTDIARRTGAAVVPPDGKDEESIDLRRMIHGIHAGSKKLYTDVGTQANGHGVREQGLIVYGYGGGVHDYSHVRFPGILQDCETCHEPGAYLLDGKWASPTANGILSSTVNTSPGSSIGVAGSDPTWIDPDDDDNISPTAAVCSACHDSDVAKAHMIVPGGAVFGDPGDTQIAITNGVVETCSVCHGPGRDADVAKVHAAR